MIQQAGAIVVRRSLAGTEVLLVRAKKDPSHWIFPKGHIEPGETPEAAALRELHEEAGVAGELVRRVGTSRFKLENETVTVDYFLVEYSATTGDGDGRETRWATLDEARRLLTFADARECLKAVADLPSGQ